MSGVITLYILYISYSNSCLFAITVFPGKSIYSSSGILYSFTEVAIVAVRDLRCPLLYLSNLYSFGCGRPQELLQQKIDPLPKLDNLYASGSYHAVFANVNALKNGDIREQSNNAYR